MIEKPWNTDCSACDNKYAYKGFTEIECPNKKCKFYKKKQEELVQTYLNELDKLTNEKKDNSSPYDYIDHDGYYKANKNSNSTDEHMNVYGYGYYCDDQDQNDVDEIKELFGLM